MHTHARPGSLRWLAIVFAIGLAAVACGPAATSPGAGTQAPGTQAPGTQAPGTEAPMTEAPGPTQAGGSPGAGGDVVMLSTQLAPAEEQTKMRDIILADYPGNVEFVPATAAEFTDRLAAEQSAGEGAGTVSLLGGLHGDFTPVADQLTDLSDLAAELSDRGFSQSLVDLGKLGTEQQLYIPWSQATYILGASSEAMQYLPEGADTNALSWQDITDWGQNIFDATGEQRLGFPAGEMGLWHRFFQGYGYPAFTGAVNTKFNSPEAVAFWEWLRDTWQYVNPQALNYDFMQEPLLSGEVWVAWDHTSRLIEAMREEGFEAFPSPAGPEGRAFMPVATGLAIPKSAPDPEAAKNLIRYLTQPETAALTLREVAFYPATEGELPEGLDAGVQKEADAVAAQTGASDALPALLPIGLGDQGGAYNAVFRNAFQSIVIDNEDIQQVLDRETPNLQAVLDAVSAPCWAPDPPSEGTCQVTQ
jgi:multiple sugar transport system substrate-binding protein